MVFLNPPVTSPNVAVDAYTYYDDPIGATAFEHRNVLYAYGSKRLVTGKYCAIASPPARPPTAHLHRAYRDSSVLTITNQR